jgi:hypothetical protein
LGNFLRDFRKDVKNIYLAEESMLFIRYVLLVFVLVGGWNPQMVFSKTITLVNSTGDNVEFEITENDQFWDVLARIQTYVQEDALITEENLIPSLVELNNEGILRDQHQINFVITHAGIFLKAKKIVNRDYKVAVKNENKKDMIYILTALAYDSLISIGLSSSSINKAGDRIDHLHPYRFLMTIFTDQELIAAVHAIRDRGGLPWSGFLDGITGSLTEEMAKDNVLQFTKDFAKKIKIDAALIFPSLKQEKWVDFVNILIDNVHRDIDPNRLKQ